MAQRIWMKITYDLPKTIKRDLQKLKDRLRDEDLPAFERHIIAVLIKNADIEMLRAHFQTVAAKRRKRRRTVTRRKT
jgi:hypothetical protein